MEPVREILSGFVVLEGLDGSGTSTQLSRLTRRLGGGELTHEETWEPTDGPVGRLIRQALSGQLPVHPDTVARLFAADRGEHLSGAHGIIERTKNGVLVISDRYLFSSLAYQGLTCGTELPAALNSAFPLPELLVFFDIAPQNAAARLASRKSLDIYENIEFQTRVDEAYRAILATFAGSGMRIAHIDASMPEDEVEKALWAQIEPVALRRHRPASRS
jgi:dTMP kinase